MCGIVGYVGPRQAAGVLLDGLKRLEYRGYDSAGLALATAGTAGSTANRLDIEKAPGRISVLESKMAARANGHTALVGLGHTRWATHGAPNEINAHPHSACRGSVAVVHNGIIENFAALKAGLISRGHRFTSETDTEVVAHLFEENLRKGEPLDAWAATLRELHGAFALAAIVRARPDEIYVARRGSPLIIGCGEGEQFVASDVPAVLPYTRRVIYLDENQMARLTREGASIWTFDLKPVRAETHEVSWTAEQAVKGGYAHFMLKEIHEQPDVCDREIAGRLAKDGVDLELKIPAKKFDRIVIAACGTAWHAALYAKYAIEELAGLPVEAALASELRYGDAPIGKKTLLLAISQSGETIDTISAAKDAQKKGARVVAITNVKGSTLARQSDDVVYMRAGLEVGVAATKTYMAQLVNALLVALWLGRARGAGSKPETARLIKELRKLPGLVRKVLENNHEVKRCAELYSRGHDFMYIGRRYNLASAYEGALKMKEISYLHAEGYGAGEMKHGPLALVDDRLVTVAVTVQGRVREKMLSNMHEIRARGGRMVVVMTEGDSKAAALADHVLTISAVEEKLSPMLAIVPLQLLAYHAAAMLGHDVDKPRNLAKSVTVE